MNRRNLLKVLSCVPVIATFPSMSFAKDAAKKTAGKKPANLQSETEGMGKAMRYIHSTKGVKNPMIKKNATCLNCIQYNKCAPGDKTCKPIKAADLKTTEYGPCGIFSGKVVARDGWCMSWGLKS